MKVVCTNRKAYHDYHIEDTLEAGIALLGTEVKSLREGRANLKDSYAVIRGGEVFLVNCHISPYSHGNIANHEPLRERKLLMHSAEIRKLELKAAQKGYSLIPLKIYLKGSRFKLQLGVAKGKKFFEKRETIKEREAKKEIERALKTSR
jgi:SsrA-binding protein